ncbi:MAG: 2-oxoglutarate oxidoreductase [Firmicutes bacterium]|nr:2-oxoglutarate oxidoreductase [Bacillota bacterium]
MKKVFTRPKSLKDVPFHYCPGCTHGIAHRLVSEVIDELGVFENTIGVGPVGCSVFVYNYFECDMFQGSHGRAPAVATGIKRVLPDRVVFTYQGDGDLAAIGTGEIVHAAGRGEKITVIFINNGIYAMTGGQMAPTTLLGQKTKTTPFGRDKDINGYPIKVCEMLAPLDGTSYIARVALHTPKNIIQAKKAIKKAFQVQMAGAGFSLVEVLSTCPTNWGLSPVEALKWVEEKMIPYYPLGEYKVPAGVV